MMLKDMIYVFAMSLAVSHEAFLVVDLTHTQSEETISWPEGQNYNFTIISRGRNKQYGYWYESNYFCTPEHGGTHLDAPAHFAEGQWRIAEIPVDRLVGPGVVINVKTKAANNSDYRVTVQDIKNWERENGKIPNKAIVLINFGWSVKYPNKTLVFGSDQVTNSQTFHFPGFHEEAMKFLAFERSVNIIGVDTPSIDYGQSRDFPVHVIVGKAEIPSLENVANLDRLPVKGAMIYVGVIKLKDGSGGPARVVGIVQDIGTSWTVRTYRHAFALIFGIGMCFWLRDT